MDNNYIKDLLESQINESILRKVKNLIEKHKDRQSTITEIISRNKENIRNGINIINQDGLNKHFNKDEISIFSKNNIYASISEYHKDISKIKGIKTISDLNKLLENIDNEYCRSNKVKKIEFNKVIYNSSNSGLREHMSIFGMFQKLIINTSDEELRKKLVDVHNKYSNVIPEKIAYDSYKIVMKAINVSRKN
ncbi:hypothetical protein FPHOBKDP_00154 [Listeria phage LPJP1]|nr:hypothetical protein FPHOBKDP_00154 [Listeria phage LPJP1]